MEFSKNRLKIAEAKEKDMVTTLSAMGFDPARIVGNDYWYHSPLRGEQTPSFKINRRLNRWYDHGMGKGGNLVDFTVQFWNCSVSEVLQKLTGNFSLHQHPAKPLKIASEKEATMKIKGDFLLSSKALLAYLEQRRIPVEVASEFCLEVRYEVGSKTWYGISFKNDLGGYEIRNAFHKLSSSPKDITRIKNGSDKAAVFEGFFDFLSFLLIAAEECLQKTDFIILNSLAFLKSTRHILDSYKDVYLFLDNDTAGKAATRLALSWGNHYYDHSRLYEGYDDLNNWLVNAPTQPGTVTLADDIIIEKPPNLPKS